MPLAVSLFSSSSAQQSVLLALIRRNLDVKEFALLQQEGGFSEPNCFQVEAFKQILQDLEFPTSNFYEYQWAIYECGFQQLLRYSPWMQSLLSSVYVYCNKRQQWGIQIQSDYFYLMVSLSVSDHESLGLVPAHVQFLEWLYDCVKPGHGYQEYYLLLTWALLRRHATARPNEVLQTVVEMLLGKKYTRQDVELLTVSDRDCDAWYCLHERIPCPENLREAFEKIILGVTATGIG